MFTSEAEGRASFQTEYENFLKLIYPTDWPTDRPTDRDAFQRLRSFEQSYAKNDPKTLFEASESIGQKIIRIRITTHGIQIRTRDRWRERVPCFLHENQLCYISETWTFHYRNLNKLHVLSSTV